MLLDRSMLKVRVLQILGTFHFINSFSCIHSSHSRSLPSSMMNSVFYFLRKAYEYMFVSILRSCSTSTGVQLESLCFGSSQSFSSIQSDLHPIAVFFSEVAPFCLGMLQFGLGSCVLLPCFSVLTQVAPVRLKRFASLIHIFNANSSIPTPIPWDLPLEHKSAVILQT